MERTWKPTTAGILSIIAGALTMITGIIVSAARGMMFTYPWMTYGTDWTEMLQAAQIVGVVGAVLIILGIVTIVGGVFALKRRLWGLALAGAICALNPLALIIPGILAIIFVAMGKGEFSQAVSSEPEAGA